MGREHRRLLHNARQQAERYAHDHPSPESDPIETLQFILNRRTAAFKHASELADGLKENEMFVKTMVGMLPHHYLRLEQDLAQEVSNLCLSMTRNEIADRFVRVHEARAALLVSAIVGAARKVGIPRDKVKELGPALREELAILEGSAEELVAA